MADAFGKQLRELRTQRQILQSSFAEQCQISPAYLSDIERGRRNPPADRVILAWARILDPSGADEIGDRLIELAARDRNRAETVTEGVVEEVSRPWEASRPRRNRSDRRAGGSDTPFLDHFQIDLVQHARSRSPAPGRERELLDIACGLSRRRRNSVVITGETSASIHQVIDGLGFAMAEGQVPQSLAGKKLVGLDGIQAGVKYRGQLEERVIALTGEIKQRGDVLLYFHNLAEVVDLEKSTNGSFLRPALESGEVQVITCSLPSETEYCRRVNPGLVECFVAVAVRALDRDAVLRGLYEVREQYAEHHSVTYSEAALVAIADAAEEGDESGFWQRAIDLLDEVGARRRGGGTPGDVSVEEVDRCTSVAENSAS